MTGGKGWDAAKATGAGLKLQERPVGKEGRVVPEVRQGNCRATGVHSRRLNAR